jgi:predicted MFS family arabinose efflux permease
MGVDAVAALILGKVFDQKGLRVLFVPLVLSMCFPFFVFSPSLGKVFTGMVLWGIGMGAQESIMRAAVSKMVTPDRRGTAYGVFNSVFGISWFAGSALMGWLYGISLPVLIGFSVLIQALALPVLWILVRGENR